MSIHSDHSEWSPVEVDSLENVDKEIQLVSTTSSESHSVRVSNRENGSVNQVKVISDKRTDSKLGQSSKNSSLSNQGERMMKLYSSCDDLSLGGQGNHVAGLKLKENDSNAESNISRSNTFANFKTTKPVINKYDHIESKIKQFFKNNETKPPEPAQQKVKNSVISKTYDKEEYLEEINKQLIKELDEKNAILSLLQENYERLLFKYAEAQNRIDELRFKFLTESSDPKNFSTQPKHNRQQTDVFPNPKCQKAVVAPFIKIDDPSFQSPLEEKPSVKRPSSLPLDGNIKVFDKDLIKATTPTDSEGLSSIITSMSGHSKILNSLDEENQMTKKSNVLLYQSGSYENSNLSDSFNKVKNWQNSLPPLEQIETPETTLYNVSSNNTGAYSSADTNYKEISSPKNEKDYAYLDESCPPSWREERQTDYVENDSMKSKPQEMSKRSLRTFSLPVTLTKQNVITYNHSLNSSNGYFEKTSGHDESTQTPNDPPSDCVLRTRSKQPPLLRCSSLPAYDCDGGTSSGKLSKNGIYVPPLDLRNVTLSDDESYCQHDYYPNESNPVTTSSFLSSQGNSVDQSIQTPHSFSSCKVTISEENSSTHIHRKTFNKSTSITPDRSRDSDSYGKECKDCCDDKTKTWCNICGETILEAANAQIFRNRSCESIPNSEISSVRASNTQPKFPFKRSVSFSSETNTPKNSPRDDRNLLISERSQESLENFEIYANNLKARSQVVIKALTAHVNNS